MRAVLAAALIAGLSIPSAAFGETEPVATTEASATDATATDAAGAESSATDAAAEPMMEATSVDVTDAPAVDDAPPATTDDSATPEVTTTDAAAEETVADTPATDPEAVPDSSIPEGTPQAAPADDPSAVDPEAEAQATTTAVVDQISCDPALVAEGYVCTADVQIVSAVQNEDGTVTVEYAYTVADGSVAQITSNLTDTTDSSYLEFTTFADLSGSGTLTHTFGGGEPTSEFVVDVRVGITNVPADAQGMSDATSENVAMWAVVLEDTPPATNADPVQIERPQLAVNDPAGAGNATWEATPQSTEAVTWSVDNLGNPVVWANDGYIFTDGTSFYSFGDAPDSEGPGLEGTTIMLDVVNASCVIAPTVTYPVFTGVRAYQVSDGTTLAPGSVVSYKAGQTISVTPLMLDGYVYNSDPLTITFSEPAGCLDTDVQLSVQAIPGTGQVQLTNTGTAAAFVQYGDDATGTTDGTLTIQPGETVTVQSTRAALYFLVSDAAGSRTIIRAVPVIPAATNPPTNPPTGTPTGTTTPPAPTGSSNTTQVTVTSNGTTVVTTVGNPQLANTGVQVREAGLLAGGLLLMGMLMLVAGRRKPQES